MGVSLGLNITQNSQSDANNTSNVTVTLTIYWTTSSYNGFSPSGTLMIDGVDYDFTSNFNYANGSGPVSTSGSVVACTKTVNIAHDSDGTKTLYCSASFDSGTASGTVTTSASKVLTPLSGTGGGGSDEGGDDGTVGEGYYEVELIIGEHTSVTEHSNTYTESRLLQYAVSDPTYSYTKTYTVNTDEGYELGECLLNGTPCANPVSFTMRSGQSATIVTTALPASYTLNISASSGVAVVVNRISSERGFTGLLNSGDTIYHNDKLTIVIELETGYAMKTCTVNGSGFTSGNSHTVTGDVTLIAIAKLTGSAHIDDGTTFGSYIVFIDNGVSWDAYVPYVDDGNQWYPYS